MVLDKETKKQFKTLSHVSTIGLTMALCVGIGAVIGHVLDTKFGTDPWLLIIFLLFGIAAGFKNLITMVNKLQKKDDQ